MVADPIEARPVQDDFDNADHNDEEPTPEYMWAPGGVGSQPEDVSYHDSDVDVPPVFRGRAPPVVGTLGGGWADYIV